MECGLWDALDSALIETYFLTSQLFLGLGPPL